MRTDVLTNLKDKLMFTPEERYIINNINISTILSKYILTVNLAFTLFRSFTTNPSTN